MDKFVRMAIIASVLLVGIAVFYHYVIFLPGVERDKAEQRAKQEQARQIAYESCTRVARSNYDSNWANACKSVAGSLKNEYANCLTDRAVMSNPYMGVNWCKQQYGRADASPECTLPKARADSINKTLESEQQRCLAEAKLGM